MHFRLRIFSTYDGFVKMKTHHKLRETCTEKIESGGRVFGFCRVEEKGRVSVC